MFRRPRNPGQESRQRLHADNSPRRKTEHQREWFVLLLPKSGPSSASRTCADSPAPLYKPSPAPAAAGQPAGATLSTASAVPGHPCSLIRVPGSGASAPCAILAPPPRMTLDRWSQCLSAPHVSAFLLCGVQIKSVPTT